MTTHLETLVLLATTRAGRAVLRGRDVYPVVRDCHAGVAEEEGPAWDGVRAACERVVDLLMRDEAEGGEEEVEEVAEEGEEGKGGAERNKDDGDDEDEDEDDEDERIEEIF